LILAQLKAIRTNFDDIMNNGLTDPEEAMADRTQQMKAAGIDKVIAEMKKQVDAWRQSK